MTEGEKIIHASRLMEFCCQAFQKAGMSEENSRIAADTLVSANLRSVDSHGVMRFHSYIQRLVDGGANPSPHIRVERRGPSFVRLDGDCGLGLVVSPHTMKEDIEIASR